MVRIHISNDSSGRSVVSFPYDPLLVARVKTINDGRWHPIENHGKRGRFYFLRLPATADKRVLEVSIQRLCLSRALEMLAANLRTKYERN